MGRRLLDPWKIAAIAVAAATAACVSTQPVFRPGVEMVGPPRFVPDAPRQQCVPYARARSGIQIRGDANVWFVGAPVMGYATSQRPAVGSLIALRIGPQNARGHIAYVTAIRSPREIIVDHANWHGREEVAVNVPVIDVSPNNDWSMVRVFWLDTGKMGARAYPVEGFILPHKTRPGV